MSPLVALGAVTILYLLYHYGGSSRAVVRLAGATGPRDPRAVFARRGIGFVLLGVVPIVIAMAHGISPRHLGLGSGRWPDVLFATGGLLIVSLPFVFRASRNLSMGDAYPEVVAPAWDRGLVAGNAATWGLYLLGYEALFRGFFLFSMEAAYGRSAAVAIVTLAYVFAHLPKDWRECAGTAPMGVFFAIAAFETDAIWAPYLAHVAVALFSDHWTRAARARTDGPRM